MRKLQRRNSSLEESVKIVWKNPPSPTRSNRVADSFLTELIEYQPAGDSAGHKSTIKMLIQLCRCIELVDLTDIDASPGNLKFNQVPVKYEVYKAVKASPKPIRRYWLLNDNNRHTRNAPTQPRVYEDEKDSNIKQKIATLVEQTMHDAQRKMKLTDELKEEHREEAPYRAGFILSMIKKSKDVLDELFNVAVKHKDEWMALEQLKIFELIVHTNVDTTNLLRQLVDVHVKHMNSTRDNKRVILI